LLSATSEELIAVETGFPAEKNAAENGLFARKTICSPVECPQLVFDAIGVDGI
jgi:hypothetical protein